MGLIGDAFSGLNQGFMVLMSISGVVISIAALVYAIALTCTQTYILLAYVYFGLYSAKNIYDFGYDMARLKKQVNRLDSETDQLENSVDVLNVANRNYHDENAELKRSVGEVKSANKELRKTQSQIAETNENLKSENIKLLNIRQQLTGDVEELRTNIKSIQKERDHLHTISTQLRAQLDVSASQVEQRQVQINLQQEQIKDLTRLLENSKKMVTNLVLAGDDYKKFNKKFGTQLTTLGETSKDLKKHTELLGKIANSLAKRVPDNKIDQVQIDEEVVKGNTKKEQKLKAIEARKNAALKTKSLYTMESNRGDFFK